MFHNMYENKSMLQIIVKVHYKASLHKIDIYMFRNNIVTNIQEV